MKGIRARFGDQVDDSAQSSAVLGLIVMRLNFELLDGIDDRWDIIRTAHSGSVDDAIDVPQILAVPLTLYRREGIRRAGDAGGAKCSAVANAAILGLVYRVGAGRQGEKRREASSVERQITDRALLHNGAQLGRSRLEQLCFRRTDIHYLRWRPHLQVEVLSRKLVYIELESLAHCRLEAGLSDRDLVLSGRNKRE